MIYQVRATYNVEASSKSEAAELVQQMERPDECTLVAIGVSIVLDCTREVAD